MSLSSQVEVKQGVLQGKECETYYGKKYYSFEGIPYAKPPVGKYRFKAPQPPESWEGIRDATKPGNKCSQLNPYSKTPIEGSEDCLYLNVYTPSMPAEKIQKLPVMVFIHGGRLIFGYGDYYKPDYLLKHDVILVTINYRLNILGFLCLDIPEVPGNAGLKDTIMALKWVRDNIEKFNGDGANVTAFGESAGAAICTSYLTSKMADGLVHKLISQSGNLISDLYMIEGEDPIEKAKTVASHLGKDINDPRSLYEFLRDVPIDELIFAFSIAEIARPPSVINAYFLPVVEKKFEGVERFFDEFPRTDIYNNRFKKLPVLNGMNSCEGALFLQKDDKGNVIYEEDFYNFVPNYMQIKRGDNRVKEIEKKIKQFYFKGEQLDNTHKLEYINLMSDKFFNFDIMMFPEMLVKQSSKVYFYKFQYVGNMHTSVMKRLGIRGASHGDSIQYQFYRKNKHDKCNEKDLAVVELLSEALCSFARHGRPSWKNRQTKWLPYSKEGKETLIIDADIKCIKNPDIERFKFWLSITGQSSKL